MELETTGVGKLTMIVWPVYIGAGLAGATPPFTLNEPFDDPVYERAMIRWTQVDDERQVIGRARILCPPGEYTHFLFFIQPTGTHLVGIQQMDHPVLFTEPCNVIDVDPIVNQDLVLSRVDR